MLFQNWKIGLKREEALLPRQVCQIDNKNLIHSILIKAPHLNIKKIVEVINTPKAAPTTTSL